MRLEPITSAKGAIARVEELEAPLGSGSDLLQVLMDAGAETLALNASHLVPEFFELKTGVAGDMLQKVSNYRKRLIILGDFSGVRSASLRDFIHESNQRGQVVFASDLEDAIAKLA